MKHRRTFGYIEIVFDVWYLVTALSLGVLICLRAVSITQILYGCMAFVLVLGDSFHLIPRIILSMRKETNKMEHALGVGKMVTSISMTVFYFLLWVIGVMCFEPKGSGSFTLVIVLLACIRVILTVLPQNVWIGEASVKWSIYRNIPFVIIGAMTALLYWQFKEVGFENFRWMWLGIIISFICYVPVVLWVKKYPMIGMLMLPKSCAYVWMITMGLTFGS